jgi:hypothetical protein
VQLSDMRTTLAGWLQDTLNTQWTPAQLTSKINLALREIEKHILSFDPDSLKATYTAATTVPSTGADNLYSYPAGTFAVHEIALSSDGVNYTPLPRRSLPIVRNYRRGGISESCFVPYDAGHFMLFPSPNTAVLAGLRVIVAPTVVMALDTDPFPLPLGFETMVLRQAQVFSLWDVGEPTETLQKEIDKLKNETPRFYLSNDQPPVITPLLSRGY